MQDVTRDEDEYDSGDPKQLKSLEEDSHDLGKGVGMRLFQFSHDEHDEVFKCFSDLYDILLWIWNKPFK